MREGLTITGTTGDEDLEQYQIQARNRDFAGTVYVYALPGSPQNWAAQLSGFSRLSPISAPICLWSSYLLQRQPAMPPAEEDLK